MNRVKYLAERKIYLDRSRPYIGYIQFMMIAILLIDKFNIQHGVTYYYIGAAILTFSGMIFIGWLDTKTKMRKYELENNTGINSIHTDTLDNTKEIKEITKQIKLMMTKKKKR